VASELANHRLNITDLNTKVLKRSMPTGRQAGKPLFVMLLEVQISSRWAAAALKRRLAKLGRSLHLEISVQELEPVAL
jgi:predicted amino acid-binding ACT domain protein